VSEPRLQLLLALADDELVMGHRHSHWTGVAPHLEEDMAFSSISQDEIGHAVIWYSLAADLTGKDPDSLGLGRPADGYRNAILVERPPRDWGYTIARHYLYDTAEDVRLSTLADSSWSAVASATGALRREERYHLMHARLWVDRLANGPIAGRGKLVDGLIAAFAESPGLFEPVDGEDELVADGTLPASHAEQHTRWLEMVSAELTSLGLEHVMAGEAHHSDGEFVPTSSGELLTDDDETSGAPADGQGLGGRRGRHSEDFADVWEEMTGTYRAFPGATW
jgi:ring-1,2-phenylacetyl-CoA epoxidase subunit PaaC